MIWLLSTLSLAEPHEPGDRPERAGEHDRERSRDGDREHPANPANPDLARLKAEVDATEAQLRLLVLDHQAAEGDAREALRVEIQTQAEAMYDLKTQVHAMRLEALEARLTAAQAEHAERDGKKAERIEAWMDAHLDD